MILFSLYKRMISSVQKNELFCTEENNLLYRNSKRLSEEIKMLLYKSPKLLK